MMVDLPEPFSPARQWISPGAMASETSSSALTPAKCLLMWRSSISGGGMRQIQFEIAGGAGSAPSMAVDQKLYWPMLSLVTDTQPAP